MTALLFDVDGVLIDSTPANARVWARWAIIHGLDPQVVVAATYGRRGVDTLEEVAPHLSQADELNRVHALFAEEVPHIGGMAGAAELLTALPAGSWGCVTSGGINWVRDRFRDADLPVPAALVTADDVDIGKPDPACYLLGAQKLGVAAGECVVVEDAAAGIEAGHAAGMRVVGLATTHSRDEITEADYVFDSLEDAAPFLLELVSGQ